MTNAAGSRERGFDSIGMCSPSIRLSYGEPNAIGNAIDYAKFRSRSHRAVIRVPRCGWQCDRDRTSTRAILKEWTADCEMLLLFGLRNLY
jgi:hypothetical protein